MKWWIVVVMLAACGGKKDDTPAAADLSKVVAKTPPTVLDEARRIIEAKRDASSLVLLAHAQAAAKRPEAKATLDAGILAARADASAEGVIALVRAIDVLVALDSKEGADKVTDEAIARVSPSMVSALEVILSPEVALEYAPAIDKLAKVAVAENIFTAVAIRRVAIDSPAWNALVAQARLVDPAARANKLQDLATRARRAGASAVAKQLAGDAAQLVLDRKADVDVFSLALEVALGGDAETAKKLVAGVAKQAHSEEAGERAIWLASLAEIYAVAGDAAGSSGFEKKALIAADRGSDDLDEPDPDQDGQIGDRVWASLVLARFARNAQGLELLDEHATPSIVEDVARDLVDHGDRALLPRVTERQKDESRKQEVADLVAEETRVDPDLDARALARKGNCMQAIVRSKDVTATKGACLAVIARYCPDSPLGAVSASPASSTAATPLDEAKRILATKKHRDPEALVLVAHAQLAAKQTDAAKATLADALATARAAKNQDAVLALVRGVAVTEALGDAGGASKLLDEAIARIKADPFHDEVIGTLLSPFIGLEHPATIQRLAVVGAHPRAIARASERIQVGSPAWVALVAAAKQTGTTSSFEPLARRAVAANQPAIAKELIAAAAAKLDADSSPAALAQLAIRAGDPATARKLLAKITDDAVLAEAYAALGDTAKSLAHEKAALARKPDGTEDPETIDDMHASIAVARALRKDVAGALAYMTEVKLRDRPIGDVAYVLAAYGDRKAAELVMANLKGEALHETTTALVELDVDRGELDTAAQRALESPMHKGEMAGIDAVLRAYAIRGDIDAIRKLGPSVRSSFKGITLDAFTDLAARVLAKQGKCDAALAAAKDVVMNLASCYAVVARYCPNSKL